MNFIAGEEQSSAPSSSLRACPWRTWDEWLSVFRSLYSDCSDPDSEPSFEDGGSGNTAALLHLHQHCQSDRQSALAHIENCWRKSAHNKLPVAVCATAALMQARRADDYQLVNEYEVRSLYALAIVRFVNQLADQCQTGQYAKSVAKLWTQDLGWPAYIVDLRHAAAHGDLPSVNVLRLACGQLLGLLRERYWEPQMAKLEAAGIYPAGGKEIRGLGSSGGRRGPAVNKTEEAEVVDPLIAAQEYFESERERNRGIWERENATAAKLAAARKQKQKAQEKIANRKNRLGKSNAAAQKQLREPQESPETPETAALERAIPFKHPGRAKRHAAAGVLGATSPAAAEHLFVAALKEGAMEKNMAAEDEFAAHFRIVFFLDWFELACDADRADFCNRVLQLLVLWKDFSTSLRDLLKQLVAVFVREAPQFRSTFRDVARGRLFDFDEETLVFVCGLVPALKEAAHVILFPALVGAQAGASPAEKKVAVAEEDLPEQANERPRTTDAAVELVPDATTAVPLCKRQADGEIDLDEQSNVGEDGDDADLAAAEQEVANLARNRKKRCRIDYSFVWQPVGSVFRFDRSSTAAASARGGCQPSTPPAPQGIGAGDKGAFAERFTDDGRTIRIPASLLADPLRGCDTRERARYSDSAFHAAVKGDEIAITGKSDRRVFDTPSEVVPREERVFDTPSEVVADELVAANEKRAIESILAELKPFGKLGK